jgi:hypothetical protein
VSLLISGSEKLHRRRIQKSVAKTASLPIQKSAAQLHRCRFRNQQRWWSHQFHIYILLGVYTYVKYSLSIINVHTNLYIYKFMKITTPQ